MTRSGVNRVSRRLAEAAIMPLTWENSVSEDRHSRLLHTSQSATALS